MKARPTPSFNAFGWKKKLFIQFLELRLVKLRPKEIVNSLRSDEVGQRISMEEKDRGQTYSFVHVHEYTQIHRCIQTRWYERIEENTGTIKGSL